MNLDGMRMYGPADEADVVVVGTGAGGAPLAAVLAEQGVRVVVLEAGPNLSPGSHTPDEQESGEINWMGERLSAGENPVAFGPNNSGRGVGGSTLHWGAFTPRPRRHDFRVHSETGMGRDWPLDLDELTPHLARVERDIAVSGPTDYPWGPPRDYLYPAARRNASSDMMVRGCEPLGIRVADAPVAVVTRDHRQPAFGLRPACVSCGACHQGCRSGAKVGTDTTYLPRAVAAGAEIRPGAMVHTIETDAAGRVSGVVYRQEGADVRQRCRTLVLAAGGVETPRLLLHNRLANSSGQVGRNFMAHGATQVWGRFDDEMRSHRGYPSSMITEEFTRPTDADMAGGYLVQSLGVMPLTIATTMIRSQGLWGDDLIRAMADYRFLAGVGMNAECLPYEDNRLELAAETDADGIPLVRVTFSDHDNERAIREHAVERMTAIVEAAGGRDIRVLDRTAHTIGTCRMGADADDAVVDAVGRSHDIPNLWISDNSTFPSAVISNPALTIMALALRTAEAMLAGRGR